VALREGFDEVPHFMHPKDSQCPQTKADLKLLKLRAALYRQLRREFGYGVTAEHDLSQGKIPRVVDCWVEDGGKKFAYWIVDKEFTTQKARLALREAIEAEGAVPHFIFANRMLKDASDSSLQFGHMERFARVCTPYDVLNEIQEGGSLHYLSIKDRDAELLTYRTLRNVTNTDVFTGNQKRSVLADTEICRSTGFLVHPGEKTHAEIVRTRKERERLQRELEPDHPEAIRLREWQAATFRLPRSNESLAEIMKRILRPKADVVSLELCREREAPCEFCGVMTRDWIVFTGQTGKCKCRTCYERISAENWRKRHEPPGNVA
jgi:hypothetical protein